jgi:hypothetical protein
MKEDVRRCLGESKQKISMEEVTKCAAVELFYLLHLFAIVGCIIDTLMEQRINFFNF